jgi:hypothetical protein
MLDVSGLVAIDVHVHAEAANAAQGDVGAAAIRYFGRSTVPTALDELAAYYRARKIPTCSCRSSASIRRAGARR